MVTVGYRVDIVVDGSMGLIIDGRYILCRLVLNECLY